MPDDSQTLLVVVACLLDHVNAVATLRRPHDPDEGIVDSA